MCPHTTALYRTEGSLRTLETTVVSIQLFSTLPPESQSLFKQASEDSYVVTTSSTIFHAQEGGGQPSDIGFMHSLTSPSESESAPSPTFEVFAVRSTPQGVIYHLGYFSPAGARVFEVNERVGQEIDGVKRSLHSRLHTAGHVLGLAVRLFSASIPGISRGKASHAPGPAFIGFRGLIDGKHKGVIQAEVSELVRQTLPVRINWWSEEEARERCTMVLENAKVKEGEAVRVCEVDGVGSYPCGGTLVTSTADLGEVRVRRISRQKGVSKVSYEVKRVGAGE